MTRYDVLGWLTLAGVFTAYCVTMWAWGLKMIKRLDRVKLTARAAAVFNNNKRPSMFDWTARRGVVERVTANKANVVVLWDGRKSMDVVPIRSVELEQSCDFPNRAPTVNRDDVFIWLSLFWFVTLCGLVIWMLLST